MKIDSTFLRSKVARRIFLLFISCALIPVGVLAVLSFTHVSKQLNQQSHRRLRHAAKAVGMTIFERLLFLEAEMRMVAAGLDEDPSSAPHRNSQKLSERLGERFLALALITDSGDPKPLYGQVQDPLRLGPAEKEHIRAGKTILSTQHLAKGSTRIFMRRALDPQSIVRGSFYAEVNPTYLWGTPEDTTLPPMTELCVLDQEKKVIFSTLPPPLSFPQEVTSQITRTTSGQFEWNYGDTAYIARHWSVFLKYAFMKSNWIVVLSESKTHVLTPMAKFKKTFPLVILLAIWIVLLLSVNQIRRSLIPLERLQKGTRRLARRDFSTQVTITSGDEFEELAGSFNIMAKQLERQFNAMTTMNEVDRSILSALDTGKIIDTVLTRMGEFFPCDCVGVALLDAQSVAAGLIHVLVSDSDGGNWMAPIQLSLAEVQELNDHPEQLLVDAKQRHPNYLASLAGLGVELFVLLPMFVNEKLSGVIALGYIDPAAFSEEDSIQARQLADQVSVALSNARLLEQLDELNWGTLYALARAIDAKSSWTAGHSERVTQLALKIGRVLGLNQKELDDLHRGGLLHDVGKIGIPPEILDKAGKLTDEEYALMRDHVRIGARILEPIHAYADVVPIVLQHHEYYDGSGYPDGVSEEAISLGARIFTVADHYDALISDRPYRAGLAREVVIDFIKEGTGKKFDPRVVEAFLKVMAAEDKESEKESRTAVQ